MIRGWIVVLMFGLVCAEAQMYDPFQKAVRMKTPPQALTLPPPPKLLPPLEERVPTVVSAIMNDKAFINGAWYRVGDKLDTQEVAFIQNSFIGLKEDNRLVILRVGSLNSLLKSKDTQ